MTPTRTHPHLLPGLDELEILDAATRREFIGMLGAAGLLAACGEDGGGASPVADAADGFPRTVDHQEGSTAIPVQPERIVAIDGRNDLDALLALDVRPTAAFNRFSFEGDPQGYTEKYYADRLEGITILEDGYNLEAVAAQNPDVILGQNIGDTYADMARIAPTISITFEDWRATTRLIARAVGADDAAERYIGEFDARIDKQAAPPGTRPSVAILDVRDNGVFEVRNDCNAHRLLLDLGYVTALGPEAGGEYSIERLSELDAADLLFTLHFAENGAPEELEATELFQQVRAVREGNFESIRPANAQTWYFPTALSAPLCLDDLSSRLDL